MTAELKAQGSAANDEQSPAASSLDPAVPSEVMAPLAQINDRTTDRNAFEATQASEARGTIHSNARRARPDATADRTALPSVGRTSRDLRATSWSDGRNKINSLSRRDGEAKEQPSLQFPLSAMRKERGNSSTRTCTRAAAIVSVVDDLSGAVTVVRAELEIIERLQRELDQFFDGQGPPADFNKGHDKQPRR